MNINLKALLFHSNDEHDNPSARFSRFGIIAAVILYSAFGYLDTIMMPESFKVGWIIRYLVILPVFVGAFFLSYSKKYHLFYKPLLTFLVITAQIGIVCMIYASKPHEEAFWAYYNGLTLIILWAVLIFRLSMPEIITTSISNVIFLNILNIGILKLHTYPTHSKEFNYLLNNNYFLI
ncbi:MAG: hypothetical protein MI922_01735, partial [Bacteroidales bacterium]|nr:hypothetical protein [Bacteroidales bacterium]